MVGQDVHNTPPPTTNFCAELNERRSSQIPERLQASLRRALDGVARSRAVAAMETRDVPGKGLGVIATRDFDVGEIVSSEPAPVALALGLDQLARRCARCARSLAAAGEDAVAPCPARCGVHYCSARCKKDDKNAHGAGG